MQLQENNPFHDISLDTILKLKIETYCIRNFTTLILYVLSYFIRKDENSVFFLILLLRLRVITSIIIIE